MGSKINYFQKVLVANRGEIACRVIRTCRSLGIQTVAVYSEADKKALHVREADQAVLLGKSDPQASYLNISKIIQAAKKTGAEAIHPGYGFLSENPELARACQKAGIVFIGPTAKTIATMGDKVAAKKRVSRKKIPTIPASPDAVTKQNAKKAAKTIGYPVLLKAAAGGGGKGMRVVRNVQELLPALEGATREAKKAFGDSRVFIEKFLERPRHIEVQVLADARGNTIHLFERDCSVQRRHQKIIEESPSPVISPAMREQLGEAAIGAAEAVNYVNAGTIEFLLEQPFCHPERPKRAKDLSSRSERSFVANASQDDISRQEPFYFLEMNTRLQVEHPVTEWIAGSDLVRWQLAIAAGQPLWRQNSFQKPQGHAMELRIYAEDPAKGFLPAAGRIEALSEPTGPGIRVDSCLYSGWEVPVHYDPLLSKVIVWGENRRQACRRALEALQNYRIDGIVTNIDFLKEIVTHPDFAHGTVDTGWVEREFGDWNPSELETRPEDPFSPWLPREKSATAKRRAAYLQEHRVDEGSAISGPLHLEAPMPGKVIKVQTKKGKKVVQGEVLMILEAMKMEHTITAARTGQVKKVYKGAGDQVKMGEQLIELT